MIEIELAQIAAVERIVEVLQTKLGDIITTRADAGLVLATPDVDDYHLTGGYVSEQHVRAPIAVLVYQLGPARLDRYESGDGTEHRAQREAQIRVQLLFAADAFDPIDRIGRDQTQAEYLAHCAGRYVGCVIQAITAYAKDSTGVQDVRVIADDPEVFEVEGIGLRGQAVVDVEVIQEVQIPTDIRVSAPDSAV